MIAVSRVLTLLALLGAAPALAQGSEVQVGKNGKESSARVVPRMHRKDARFAITNRPGNATLLLTDYGVAMQLTDRGLEDAFRDQGKDGQAGFWSRMLGAAMRSSVRAMLDHAIEYPYSEVQEIRFHEGRIILVNADGTESKMQTRVNDTEVMESFRERDAHAFIAEFRKVKARSRQ